MGDKGKKVSALSQPATADNAPRAQFYSPAYLVWMKSYLFVYVSLSAVCTLSRRCSARCHRTPDTRERIYIYVYIMYIRMYTCVCVCVCVCTYI